MPPEFLLAVEVNLKPCLSLKSTSCMMRKMARTLRLPLKKSQVPSPRYQKSRVPGLRSQQSQVPKVPSPRSQVPETICTCPFRGRSVLDTLGLGPGTWDLGLGTWDLGLGTWDIGIEGSRIKPFIFQTD